MKTSNIWVAIVACLLITVGIGLADDSPDIRSFSNGQITWTNVNPNLYYTVEWKPTLTGTNSWTGSFRNLQDLQSSASIVTSTVPAFFRIVGSSNMAHTAELSSTTTVVNAGYYETTDLEQVETNLASGNIRAGVSIFGISGNPNVVNTSSGTAHYPTIKFGKIAWVDGIELTGTLAGGKSCDPGATYSPLKRWCHNGDGTITDTTTGLTWYHKGNWFWGAYDIASRMVPCPPGNIADMSHGSPADLTDGSYTFDWRLPTANEMLEFTSGVEAISPSTQYLFTGIQTAWYWTCTMSPNPTPMKFMKIQMPEVHGYATAENLDALHYAMAVRGPL